MLNCTVCGGWPTRKSSIWLIIFHNVVVEKGFLYILKCFNSLRLFRTKNFDSFDAVF